MKALSAKDRFQESLFQDGSSSGHCLAFGRQPSPRGLWVVRRAGEGRDDPTGCQPESWESSDSWLVRELVSSDS